jgi:DNA-binding NtrC family response regulator
MSGRICCGHSAWSVHARQGCRQRTDEPLIRRLGVVALEEAGYAVIQAEDAAEALDALEAGREIHRLFTDIQIPGSLDGLQLAHLVSRRWPTVRLLICSGKVHPDELPTDGEFLPKPYAVEDMLKQVSRLIAA